MAKIFSCCKCGSVDLFLRERGSSTGLYCRDCGAWQKWVGKDEKRLVELQIAESKPNSRTHFDEEREKTDTPEKMALKILHDSYSDQGRGVDDLWYTPAGRFDDELDAYNAILDWLNSPVKEG